MYIPIPSATSPLFQIYPIHLQKVPYTQLKMGQRVMGQTGQHVSMGHMVDGD